MTDTGTTETLQTSAQPAKHILAVASGKGGVGKSTVTVNLALALLEAGHRVAVLDADIYGPSLGKMLGINDQTRPEIVRCKEQSLYRPLSAYGLQVMSMAFLTGRDTPVIWRGPMAGTALRQMLFQTAWEQPDFLLADMPPGTGDIALTLAQKSSLSGAIIVTTPQDVALEDVRRCMEMFRKVRVPLQGVIENMAEYTCPSCGHKEALFGSRGGSTLASGYTIPLLASLPLTRQMMSCMDRGTPVMIADPASDAAGTFRHIAGQLPGLLQQNPPVSPAVTGT